jgi:hypothetical protein
VSLAREKLLTLDSSGRVTTWKAAAWPAGGSCAIVLREPDDRETEAKVTALFSWRVRQRDGAILQVISRGELERMGAIPQAALMLEAGPGFAFDEVLVGAEVHPTEDTFRGTHGYLPANPEMRASLIVYGAGVRPGAIVSQAQMIDVAPTIAILLGLDLPQAEGRPITEILER